MSRQFLFAASAALSFMASAPRTFAADQSPAETKLREQLRNTMLQLRTAETERAALQAAQAEAATDKQTLTDQVTKLTKQIADDQSATKKQIDDLTAKETAKDADIQQMKATLDKWKAALAQRDEKLAKAEGDRSKLQMAVIELQRHVDDQRRKNQEMHKVGIELLTRYQQFGLGTALTAREPFIGTTRVKMESLAQDYQDRIADATIKPDAVAVKNPDKPAKKN